ncbi:MAG: heavy-metal-associated domain-containing protein [Butyricicoccaceae bacterium]
MQAIKRELDALPGVQSVSVSQTGRIAVDYDTTGTDAARIAGQLQKPDMRPGPVPTERRRMRSEQKAPESRKSRRADEKRQSQPAS